MRLPSLALVACVAGREVLDVGLETRQFSLEFIAFNFSRFQCSSPLLAGIMSLCIAAFAHAIEHFRHIRC